MEENKKVVEMGNVDVTGAVDPGKKISIFKKPTKKTLVVGVVALAAVGTIATVIFKGSKKDDCTGAVDQDDFDDSYEADDSEDEEESEKEEI